METLLTKENITFGIVGFLCVRYGLLLLDKFMQRWFKTSANDHKTFMTFESCQLHRDNCFSDRAVVHGELKHDLLVLKQVMFRIGRKLEIEDSVLERLISDTDD